MAQRQFEDVLDAEILEVYDPGDGGPFAYSWREVTLDPSGTGMIPVDGGRFGGPGDGVLYENNDFLIPVGAIVRIKVRGVVDGGVLAYDCNYEDPTHLDGVTIVWNNVHWQITNSTATITNSTINLSSTAINVDARTVVYHGTPVCHDYTTNVCLLWEDDGAVDLADAVPPGHLVAGPVSGPDDLATARLLVPTDIPDLSSVYDTAGAAAAAQAASAAYTDAQLAAYTGTANVVTLGTITAGVWQGTPIAPAYLENLGTVTGARNDPEGALKSLLDLLSTNGRITDATTIT